MPHLPPTTDRMGLTFPFLVAPGLSALGDLLEARIANAHLAAVVSYERLLCEGSRERGGLLRTSLKSVS